MYYIILQLFKEEYLDDIMLAFTTVGIDNGTILDGINSDNILNQHIPLFTGLIPNESQKSRYCKVLTSVIDSLDIVDNLLEMLRDADIDFKQEGIGRIIVLPAYLVIDEDNDWKKS